MSTARPGMMQLAYTPPILHEARKCPTQSPRRSSNIDRDAPDHRNVPILHAPLETGSDGHPRGARLRVRVDRLGVVQGGLLRLAVHGVAEVAGVGQKCGGEKLRYTHTLRVWHHASYIHSLALGRVPEEIPIVRARSLRVDRPADGASQPFFSIEGRLASLLRLFHMPTVSATRPKRRGPHPTPEHITE